MYGISSELERLMNDMSRIPKIIKEKALLRLD
jgi:hypothetical protein